MVADNLPPLVFFIVVEHDVSFQIGCVKKFLANLYTISTKKSGASPCQNAENPYTNDQLFKDLCSLKECLHSGEPMGTNRAVFDFVRAVLASQKTRGFAFLVCDKKQYLPTKPKTYMKVLLGTKDGMTQVFDDQGVVQPATVLRIAPTMITKVKTKEVDGYDAIQIASGEQKAHRVAKAQQGALAYQHVKEFRPNVMKQETIEGLETGATIDAATFAAGDTIEVSAISKGKGFQGVVKRHGFAGGPRTHGNKHHERAPGSIGSTGPSRVFKGLRMAGRMGADRVTVKNLKVLQVNAAEGILLVSGAVPGRKGTLVEVRGI